jgi:hypothetical protein
VSVSRHEIELALDSLIVGKLPIEDALAIASQATDEAEHQAATLWASLPLPLAAGSPDAAIRRLAEFIWRLSGPEKALQTHFMDLGSNPRCRPLSNIDLPNGPVNSQIKTSPTLFTIATRQY